MGVGDLFDWGGGSVPTFLVAVSGARGTKPKMTSPTREPTAAQAAEATSHVENLPHVRKIVTTYAGCESGPPERSFWLRSLESLSVRVSGRAVPRHPRQARS